MRPESAPLAVVPIVGPASRLPRRGVEDVARGGVEVYAADVGAFARVGEADLAAEAGGGAGYEGGFAAEAVGHCFGCCLRVGEREVGMSIEVK